MTRKTIIGIILITVIIIAVLGMRHDFNNMQALSWHINDPKAVEGYEWLANNTESDATILAWWDYADPIESLGHRNVVIKEASENIKYTIASYNTPGRPWRKIEYDLWYPFEPEEKVRDVADFFVTDNETYAVEIARKYNSSYVLVMYPWDVYKFNAIVTASGKETDDYFAGNASLGEITLNKETVGTKMILGEEVRGFEKIFDNERMRIYSIGHQPSGYL